MTPKTEAQAFYNVLPPNRRDRRAPNSSYSPRVTAEDARKCRLRRDIERRQEEMAIAREFQLC